MDRYQIQGSDNFSKFNHGHMIVDINGRKCNVCGNYGCIEAYSSISSIKEEVLLQLKQGKESMLQHQFKNNKDIKFEDIYHAVNQKYSLCFHIINKLAFFTVVGILYIINLLNS